MEKILIGVASIVLIVSLVVVGSIIWLNHKNSELQAQLGPKLDLKDLAPKLDFRDPAMAASFRKSYADNCIATFQKNAGQASETPTDDQLDSVRPACGCIADHMIVDLAKKALVSGFDLLALIGSDQEVPGVKSCAGKLP